MKSAFSKLVRLMLSMLMLFSLLAPVHVHGEEEHAVEHCCAATHGVQLEQVPCNHDCDDCPLVPDGFLPGGQKITPPVAAVLNGNWEYRPNIYSRCSFEVTEQSVPPLLLLQWCSVRLLC